MIFVEFRKIYFSTKLELMRFTRAPFLESLLLSLIIAFLSQTSKYGETWNPGE